MATGMVNFDLERSCCRRPLASMAPLCVVVIAAVLLAYGAVGASAAPYSFSRLGEHTCGEAEAGELCNPVGVGVDGAGNVYVGDAYDYRVDKFASNGKFLLAWGLGVLNGANELQVCTTSCQTGQYGVAGFQPLGVAVDSSGDVYVFDWGHFRVEKFDPNGKFLLMFGGNVNKSHVAANKNICTASEEKECQPGTEGTGNGEFGKSAYLRSYITVGGPAGDVYVGEQGRVQAFEPSGAYRETISLAALSSTSTGTGTVSALAVNPAGDVFVKIGDDQGGHQEGAVPGVRELEPSGSWIPSSVEFDKGSETIHSIAVDNLGDLYVGDAAGGFHILQYEVASGLQLATFGSGTATDSEGMAFSPTEDRLYVAGYGDLWAYTLQEPGPIIEPESPTVVPGSRGAATFSATVNPEGAATEVKVECVDDAHYTTSGYASASSSASVPIGSSFADQHIEIKLPAKTLVPGVTYHWRLVASNSRGTQMAEGKTFEEIPAALVDGPWATEVASTSVTLAAKINPEGVTTEYELEYGTSTTYETVLRGKVVAGEEYVLVSYPRQGLSPSTIYHYRLVTTNTIGSVETTDRTFNTQPATSLRNLPDGRAWELVSPINKHGALIEPAEGKEGDIQASVSGTAIGYVANEPLTEEPSASVGAYVVSTRVSRGWKSKETLPSQSLPEGSVEPAELLKGFTPSLLFSLDMARSAIEPSGAVPPQSLSPEATERTVFLHDTTSGRWTPLVTPADNEIGEPFGGTSVNWMHFLMATPDLSHVVFSSPYALTTGSKPAPDLKLCEKEVCFDERNIYEWASGKLLQVNVLPPPDGEPTFHGFLGRANSDAIHAVSNDGRWIVWEYWDTHGLHMLYVRDMVEGKTIEIGDRRAIFQTMSASGSRIFFLDGPRVEGKVVYDLYELNTATGVTTDVTATHGVGEIGANVEDAVVGASEDGSYVYFVADGMLAEGAVRDGSNLYVAHEEGGAWKVALVVTLSENDEKDWSALQGSVGTANSYQRNELITSRVSPNGRFVAFMSDRQLTGYDNKDAVSGQRDEEVFEYDARAGSLVCVSCNRSGARPVGAFDPGAGIGSLLVDRAGAWQGHWLAGSMVGWREVQSGRAVYQPRSLSDSGRLFFESPDALVPLDTNGLEDVYEYEPVKSPEGPSSSDCTSESPRFSERSNGCVSLISSGTSDAESTFYDASATGDDAFFLTASKLVPTDYDNSFDVYDAHVCSAAAPCPSEPVRPPECDSSDSCKATPAPQPEFFGPPPSATFSGAGNVPPPSARPAVKKLTRAQELRRALKACRKKRRRQRTTCERRARTRYARKGKGARRAGR